MTDTIGVARRGSRQWRRSMHRSLATASSGAGSRRRVGPRLVDSRQCRRRSEGARNRDLVRRCRFAVLGQRRPTRDTREPVLRAHRPEGVLHVGDGIHRLYQERGQALQGPRLQVGDLESRRTSTSPRRPRPDITQYAKFFTAVRSAILSVDPKARVAGRGTDGFLLRPRYTRLHLRQRTDCEVSEISTTLRSIRPHRWTRA